VRYLLSALLLSGCTVQVPTFPHTATASVEPPLSLSVPDLAAFSHGGVLLRPEVEPNRVLGTFYGPAEAHVIIKQVTLTGLSGGAVHTAENTPIDVAVTEPVEGGFASKRKLLILLDGWGVDELGEASEGLRLTVELVVDGEPGTLAYTLPLVMVRRIQWPT